jgi:uncharacterized protein YhjY with autotransporter beta-barrel domain
MFANQTGETKQFSFKLENFSRSTTRANWWDWADMSTQNVKLTINGKDVELGQNFNGEVTINIELSIVANND